MPKVFITEKTHDRLVRRADFPWKETGRQTDGGWIIDISTETYERIEKLALDDETFDATLTRILDKADTGGIN